MTIVSPETNARKRLPLPSWLPWIAIPIVFILAYSLFSLAWQVRAERIGEELCNAYFPISETADGSETAQCGGLDPSSLVSFEKDTGWHTSVLIFSGADKIATTMAQLEDGAAEPATAPDEAEAEDPLGKLAVRCDPLPLGSFSFHPLRLGYSQDASYDSIARVIEACTQSRASDIERALQLCTGTRNALSPQICNKSLQFAGAMQRFDRSDGAWIVTALVVVGIIFGLFQLVTLVLAIWSLSAAIRLSDTVQGRSKSQLAPDEGIEQWTDLARFPALIAANATLKATQKVSEEKREQTYNALRDTYIDAVDRKFRRVEVFGDLVVLLGLLGTLYGMLILFAALAETGSADPLTAELASSRMLGSLGLAFGTTIFAAGLRFVLLLGVPILRDPAEIEAKNIYIEAFQGLALPEVSKTTASGKVVRDNEVLPGFDDVLPELDSWGWGTGFGGAGGSNHRFPIWAIAFVIVLVTLLFLFTGLIADIQALRTNQ
ncbi:MotA/TolQ/ExbB proton channel family protein [uncultured Litoreibacter sp.]|uniref:MotA/TolQ/ExbB proton channel family protein n=1 Tax=uncultured Litoreibacter sp. TaxID=1392394 RepID=UPI0026116D1E|nr:MotA/TolQ/ExbB proton channel family protein [uncultured Litoreibacter sp.]